MDLRSPITATATDGRARQIASARQLWREYGLVMPGEAAAVTLPLVVQGSCVGAIGLWLAPGSLDRCEEPVRHRAPAAVAGQLLTLAAALDRSQRRVDQLEEALVSRVIIKQAKGALALQLGTTPDTAFDALRRYCRNHGLTVRSVARTVVNGASGSETVPHLVAAIAEQLPGSVD